MSEEYPDTGLVSEALKSKFPDKKEHWAEWTRLFAEAGVHSVGEMRALDDTDWERLTALCAPVKTAMKALGGRRATKALPPIVAEFVTIAGRLSSAVWPPPSARLGNMLQVLAFDILKVTDEWRAVMQQSLTDHLLEKFGTLIRDRDPYMGMLLCLFGNTTSNGDPAYCTRVVKVVPTLIESLRVLILTKDANPTPTNATFQECALWIIVNTAHGCIYSPPHLDLFKPLFPVLIPFLEKWDRNKQVNVRAYRACCALFPTEPRVLSCRQGLDQVLLEYEYALQGSSVPGTNFHPDPDDRALTMCCLSASKEGRTVIVKAGAVPFLRRSLFSCSAHGPRTTARLWTFAVKALHNIATTRDHHAVLLRDSDQEKSVVFGLTAVASSSGRQNLLLPFATRRLAADAAVALNARWDVSRLVWLAVFKNDRKTCFLARLPKVLVRPIVMWLMLFSEVADDAHLPTHGKALLAAQFEGKK